MEESIDKAIADAAFLVRDIQEAHNIATEENPLAEIILMELISDAVAIEQKISRLHAAIGQTR